MLTSKEFIFDFWFLKNVWVMMSMGEGIAKIRGLWWGGTQVMPGILGNNVPHPRALYPSCKDDEANAIVNLKIGRSCGVTWMILYFFRFFL
jgi:hypothetical protein